MSIEDKITEELMERMVQKWTKIGLTAEPSDRETARLGALKAFKEASLDLPNEFLWVDSPFQGAVASYILSRVGQEDELFAHLEKGGFEDTKDTLPASLRFEVVMELLWDGFFVRFPEFEGLDKAVFMDRALKLFAKDKEIGSHISDQLSRCGYGQHDAPWLGFYDTFGEAGVDVVKRLEGLMDIAKSCGWWWPFNGLVIFSERPRYIHMDSEGRLHSERGPAIEYPDGFCVYATNGERKDFHPLLPMFEGMSDKDTNEKISQLRLEAAFRIPDAESLEKIQAVWEGDDDSLGYVAERSDHDLVGFSGKKGLISGTIVDAARSAFSAISDEHKKG